MLFPDALASTREDPPAKQELIVVSELESVQILRRAMFVCSVT
jgi:hypothetical protein